MSIGVSQQTQKAFGLCATIIESTNIKNTDVTKAIQELGKQADQGSEDAVEMLLNLSISVDPDVQKLAISALNSASPHNANVASKAKSLCSLVDIKSPWLTDLITSCAADALDKLFSDNNTDTATKKTELGNHFMDYTSFKIPDEIRRLANQNISTIAPAKTQPKKPRNLEEIQADYTRFTTHPELSLLAQQKGIHLISASITDNTKETEVNSIFEHITDAPIEKPIVILCNPGGNHWTTLILMKDKSEKVEAHYFDSNGSPFPYAAKLKQVMPNATITVHAASFQRDNNCGPHVFDILRYIAEERKKNPEKPIGTIIDERIKFWIANADSPEGIAIMREIRKEMLRHAMKQASNAGVRLDELID